MSRHATDAQGPAQECVPSPPLPADHVLDSGAVLFPGAFDQHGCPLVVFPADGQARLCSELSKAEVVDFINYFACLHSKRQEKDSLVSVVADLRHASPPTARFVAETLLLLELHRRTVHSVYVLQPKKRDAAKLLLKLLAPAKSRAASFKKVLLKEIPELCNYIDRSQLMAPLGGYLLYCHHSWVAFIKEIDAFVQEFLSVVQRLPSCISTLQALSRLPLPATSAELRHFCSTNEAKFLQLRSELGLDQLLGHCERVVEKLRHPEREPCYQAMAGTALFTHTAFDMLHNHSRITAAVEKVELLWQQAFSQARLQLQVFQLREDALQITQQIETLLQEKLQPYAVEVAKDAARAAALVSHFETSIHTPAVALVRCAEDVIHTLEETLPLDGPSRERWVLDLERLKEKLHSAVRFVLQTLRAVASYHHYFNKASSWYRPVLCENFLQELLSGVSTDGSSARRQRTSWGSTVPAWRRKLSTFLKKNPPPDAEELLHLAHLAHVIPEEELQQAGRQMSQRCLTLRKLLISSGPVAVGHLQLALQWQYDLLRSSRVNQSSSDGAEGNRTAKDGPDCPSESDPPGCEGGKSPPVSAEGKPLSLSSFDSGFDGAGSGPLEAWGGRERVEGPPGLAGTRDSGRPATNPPRIREDDVSSVSDSENRGEEFYLGSAGSSSGASIHIIPKVTEDTLNLEIKVRRSAALPSNPWLSLPVDDLENSYTVTITHNPTPQKTGPQPRAPSDPRSGSRDEPAEAGVDVEAEAEGDTQPGGRPGGDWTLHSESSLDDTELSPICNILSSTITEGRERSVCTTEGAPTLLWDSYDLHDQNPDAVDGEIDFSQKDWDEKEQEGLREVEKILGRTDEILEEEESVLAQEAVLEALLRSESGHSHWPAWDSEDQLGVLSSTELTEAGVLGFEDHLDPAEPGGPGEPRSAVSASDAEAWADDGAALGGRPDLLAELRTVRLLDELILEEDLKIRELRRREGDPGEDDLPGSRASDGSREREAFRLQLQKERREVEELEEGLDEERVVEQHKGGAAGRVVTCSVMDRARTESEEDRALCDELLSESCNRSQRSPSPSPSSSPSPSPQPSQGAWTDDPGAEPPPTAETGTPPEERAHGEESGGSAENPPACRPEASLTPETKPGDGAFDPGGRPARDDASTPGDGNPADPPPPPAQAHDPAFTQPDRREEPPPPPPEVAGHALCSPNMMEHRNNNNNNHSATKAAEDACPLPALVPPARPLEFDPGGGTGTDEDSPGGVESSEAVRISGSGLSGVRAQLDVDMRQVMDFKTPIVLDTGSGLMKAGFADEDRPSVVFPTIIGVPKYEEIMNGNLQRETYIGHEAQHMRGVLALTYPIKNGIIRNWDEMEKIWHHAFQQLGVDPEDHPVLLTEAAMNPLGNRQRMVEIMFECFNVPLAYVALQAVLALYAAGRSTGVVFDSGDGVSHSVPVFEGYCLPHAVQRFPLAGVDVTMQLKKLLQEQGVSMRTTAETEIVREMKEECCCVALDYEAELRRGGSSSREVHYTMPDGQIVTLGAERFRAPEILFRPELIGQEHYGVHESIFKSVLSSDIDLRRGFLGNIVLSGGNTLLAGLPERLQAEIRGLVPADGGESVRVSSPEDRDFSVWSGGAVLASLPTFASAWISQEEYEEFGPQIVFRKCF